jgi:hypothetical protein
MKLLGLILALELPLAALGQTNYTPYTFETLAGLASFGSPGNGLCIDGVGSAARFNNPIGVATDTNGNVYVGDTYNQTIRKITSAGVVTTLAGQAGSPGSADGPRGVAQFAYPEGVAVDSAGNIYVADSYFNTIRKVTPAGTVSTLAGLANPFGGYADGTGTNALFNLPVGVAVDSSGNVYVADQSNNRIRKVTPGGAVSTLAGAVRGYADGTGSAARFNNPRGIAVATNGNVYVAEYFGQIIRKITPGGAVSTFAGLGSTNFIPVGGYADGTNETAQFNFPTSVAVDMAGNLYVGDNNNSLVRRITIVGTNRVASTLAGLARNPGSADGTGSAARFYGPFGVAVDNEGKVYVADAYNNTIRVGFPGTPPILGNVRASQQAGGATVDLFYDLAGAALQNPVGVSVSIDGGISFNVTATHFTGDGIQNPVGVGANYHVVWDAGADLDAGYFPNAVVQMSAIGSYARSSVFVANLRGLAGGLSLSGTVLDGVTGNGVVGALVQLGTNSTVAGSQGAYSFPSLSIGSYSLMASRSGYVSADYSIVITPGSASSRVVTLWPTNSASASPTVTSVSSKYAGFRYFMDGVPFNVQFIATVDWAGHPPGTVQFITPHKTYTVSASGSSVVQTLAMGSDFGPNGRLRVVAMSGDGTKSSSQFGDLVVTPSPFPVLLAPVWGAEDAGSSFSYNTTLSTTIFKQGVDDGIIPSTIPVLGGQALRVDFIPRMECSVKSDGTATLAMKWDNLDTGQVLEAERQNQGLKSLTDLLNGWVANGQVDPQLLPQQEFGGITWYFYPELGGGWKYSMDAGQWQPNGAFAGLGTDISVSRTWPFLVGYVPMYAKLSAELSVDATANLLQLSPLSLSGEVNVDPSLRGTLGVGISEVLAAEGWVEGGANVDMQWPQAPGGNPASLYVKAGATLYYLIGHKDYSGLIWSWPEGAPANGKFYSVLTQQGSWKPLGRGYLNYASTGSLGGKPARPKLFGESGGGANPEVLMSPAMPFADPNCSSSGTSFYMVFLEDNTNRTSMNRTMAMFSHFDGTLWSLPIAVADDGTADFHPRILTFADGSAVAAWENEGTLQPDTAVLSDMVSNLEVSVAWYDPTAGTWLAALQMTTNSFLDRSPKLAGRAKDNMLLTWICNPANDTDGSAAAPNQIWSAKWNGVAWSVPQVVTTVSNALLKYDLVYDGTNANLVMSVDTVSGSTNANGHELFRLACQNGSWGALTQLTSDQVPDDNPQMILDSAGNVTLAWLKGSELSSVVNFNQANRLVARTSEYSSNLADFTLAGSSDGKLAFLWAEPSENNSDLYAVFYDPIFGVWGMPRQWTHDPQAEYGKTMAFYGTNELIAVYNRTLISSTNSPDTSLADLAAYYYPLSRDLAMDSSLIYCDPPNPNAGAIATVHARVLNYGDQVETNVVVAFYQYAIQASNEMGRVTLTNALAPQGTNDVAFTFLVPDSGVPLTVFAVVDPDQTVPDVSRANNVARLDLVKPGMAIQSMNWSPINSNLLVVTVHVVNDGAITNGPVTLSLRSGSGTNLFSQGLGGLVPGASVDVSFLWNVFGLPDNVSIYAVLSGPGMSNNFSVANTTGQLAVSLAPPPWIGECQYLPDGRFQMAIYAVEGRSYVLQASTNLVNWVPVLNFTCTDSPTVIVDSASVNYVMRFYRIAPLSSIPPPRLGFDSSQPMTTEGFGLTLEGLSGVNYRVDFSTNVVDWAPFTNLVSTNSLMYFRDSGATNGSRRYYRAVVP